MDTVARSRADGVAWSDVMGLTRTSHSPPSPPQTEPSQGCEHTGDVTASRLGGTRGRRAWGKWDIRCSARYQRSMDQSSAATVATGRRETGSCTLTAAPAALQTRGPSPGAVSPLKGRLRSDAVAALGLAGWDECCRGNRGRTPLTPRLLRSVPQDSSVAVLRMFPGPGLFCPEASCRARSPNIQVEEVRRG